jgi:hypothetical protein
MPISTADTNLAAARCASRLPPSTVRVTYRNRRVDGSRPAQTRICHTPGRRSRMLPCMDRGYGKGVGLWTDYGLRSGTGGKPKIKNIL